jgi:hypothetical protein
VKSRQGSVAREIAIRGVLVLLGVAASLFLSEWAVRVAGVAPDVVVIQRGRFRLSDNPKIGYEPLPGVHYLGDSQNLVAYRGSGNSLGYRDYEHSIEKPEGIFRIVVLGDSIGVGLYVERWEDTFPAALEDLLTKDGLQVEVINLSVIGYNTQQEVETLKERGLRYEPDLVVLAYCLNDRALNEGGIMGTLLDAEMESGAIPRARVNTRWLIRSALYRFLRYTVFPPETLEASERRENLYDEITRDTTEEYFHELERMGRENGFQVLVAIFPELTNLAEYRYAREHARVARISEECGFESIDLLQTFRFCEAMADEEIGYDRYHPTPPGYHCAADAVATFIRGRILNAPSWKEDGAIRTGSSGG